LLAVEQGFFAVDIEAILLRLRVVGALRLLKGELRFLQGVLSSQRLQFGVGAEFVGLAAAVAFVPH
jgi:hypothetical protein